MPHDVTEIRIEAGKIANLDHTSILLYHYGEQEDPLHSDTTVAETMQSQEPADMKVHYFMLVDAVFAGKIHQGQWQNKSACVLLSRQRLQETAYIDCAQRGTLVVPCSSWLC